MTQIPVNVTITPEAPAQASANQAKAYAIQGGQHAAASELAQGLSEAARDLAVSAANTLAALIASLDEVLAVQGDLTEINAVYAKLTEIQAIYTSLANVDAVAVSVANVNAVSAKLTELTDLHTNLATLLLLHTNLGTYEAVAAISTEIAALYANLTALQSLYANLTALLNLNTNLASVQAVEGKLEPIESVATNMEDVQSIAENMSNVNAVAADLGLGVGSKVTIVADSIANVNTVAADIADVTLAASKMAEIEAAPGAATDAATARDKAEDWAEKAEDVEVETGKYSAKHHALKAEGFKDDAAASAVEAAGYVAYPRHFFDDAIVDLSNKAVAEGATVLKKLRYLQEFLDFIYDEVGLIPANQKVIWFADNPAIVRTDGVLKYYREGFDGINLNDLDGSAVAATQPRLVGGLAPGSHPAASNQNGESRYFTHTPISFAANQAWSLSLMFNLSRISDFGLFGGNDGINNFDARIYSDVIRLFYATENVITSVNVSPFLGKFSLLTITYNNGSLSMYVNGLLVQNISISFNAIFNALGTMTANTIFPMFMKYRLYMMQSGELIAQQVEDLYTLLSTKYPKIEYVIIGSLIWTSRSLEVVTTPRVENVIANVTEAGVVEKITVAADRDFSSDTGWWTKVGECTINNASSGVCNILSTVGDLSGILRDNILVIGKWYEIIYEVPRDGGGTIGFEGFSENTGTKLANNTLIKKATDTRFLIKRLEICDVDIDNFSVKELNWSNSSEIYDAVYAATAGTASEKAYAALKEAANWAYHTNSLDLGATYGKIYNGYAKDLLVDDIALTAGWGYHIATEAELTALAALNGLTLKYPGTDTWTTANGTNTTGLTVLGGASRNTDGTFNTIKATASFWCADSDKVLTIYDDGTAAIEAKDKTFGAYIRLVKD